MKERKNKIIIGETKENKNYEEVVKMKLWNIEPLKIKLSFKEIDAVVLGEEGRGRKRALVPMTKIENNDAEWVARLSAEGTYTRGTYGTVYVLTDDRKKIKIIDFGLGAYGDAGRIGSWGDFLVAIEETPVRFLMRPSGGPAKRERYWIVFDKDKVYTVKQGEIDVFKETIGIDIPDLDLEEGMAPYEEAGILIDLYDLVV